MPDDGLPCSPDAAVPGPVIGPAPLDAPLPRVILVNRFFFPDHSATSQMASDLMIQLASCGLRCRAIASQQGYDAPGHTLPPNETVHGVVIHRVPTTRFGRAGLPGRALDYASFYASAFLALVGQTQRGDLIIAKTDPPLVASAAGLAAWIKGAEVVQWHQDVYPEVAGALGLGWVNGWVGWPIRALRHYSLTAGRAHVAIGEIMAERLVALGAPVHRVHIIPNWADESAIRPLAAADNPLRSQWGLNGKVVVGYSGNLGRAHDGETLLRAAELLQDREDIVFLMIGGGQGMGALAEAARTRGIGNIQFRPYQPRERLDQSLGAADVHWLSLKPELEGLIVPSKIYGILAAGRPTIFLGEADGEIGRLVARHRCGLVVRPGDADGFADACVQLAEDPARRGDMGRAARAAAEGRCARARAFEAWEALLTGLAR